MMPPVPTTAAHPPPLGEKTVAGIPWRYGDPESAFEWGDTLGEGSRSTVRAATRVQPPPPGTTGAPLGTRCAVKVLSKTHPRFSALDARSEVEAHAAAAVCPDAVTLHEVWEDDAAVYLVQAACDGGELYERVRAQGRLPEPDAAAAIAAVLRLLAHMHAGGWVHRDVKLENFMYAGVKDGGGAARPAGDAPPGVTPLPPHSTRGRLLGVDFGSATRLAPGDALTGPPAGSVPYLSPEAVAARAGRAAAVGAPADMWSAGCVLFALLSGQLPFGGDTDTDILAAIDRGVGGVPRGAAWSRVSDQAADLVKHLLARDPSTRPSAVDALQHPWLLAGGECGADGGPRAPLSRAEARARAKEAAREAAAEARGRLAGVMTRARERVRETRDRWRARRTSG